MPSIALIHREKIINQIANGALLRDVAAQLGVCKQTISAALHSDPEYQAAIEQRWESKLDDTLQAIEAAGDDLDAVRAREAALRRIEWRAERECSQRWGQKSTLTVDLAPDLADRLREGRDRVRQLRERTVEGSVVGAPQNSVIASHDAGDGENGALCPLSTEQNPVVPAPHSDPAAAARRASLAVLSLADLIAPRDPNDSGDGTASDG